MWNFFKSILPNENKEKANNYKIEIKEENTEGCEIISNNDCEDKIDEEETGNEEIYEDPLTLYFLFNESFKLESNKIRKRIEVLENDIVKINNLLEWEDTNKIFAYATIGKEKFKLVGLDLKIPSDLINNSIHAHDKDYKETEKMKNHKYHIIVFYEGRNKNINEVFSAFAKLAYGFYSENFLGVINGYSLSAINSKLISDMFEKEEFIHLAKSPSLNIWRKIVQVNCGDKIWFVTKGNNLYGIKEFAYKGTVNEYKKIQEIFERIFYYIYSTKTIFKSGSTYELTDDAYVIFKELYEYKEQLEGNKLGTLVVELIIKKNDE